MFFFIITPLIEKLLKEQKCFKVVICNRINLLFLHLCVKSELEELRSHKVVTVKSIEFDLLLLVSLQCARQINAVRTKNLVQGDILMNNLKKLIFLKSLFLYIPRFWLDIIKLKVKYFFL